jgi:hypothetical protein
MNNFDNGWRARREGMKAYISGTTECKTEIDLHVDPEDGSDRENIRDLLDECFTAIWDDKITVIFEDEHFCPSCNKEHETARKAEWCCMP